MSVTLPPLPLSTPIHHFNHHFNHDFNHLMHLNHLIKIVFQEFFQVIDVEKVIVILKEALSQPVMLFL
jgi:hypothetical protein